MTNSLKHADARRADVTVRYGPEGLQLEVRDDGTGAETGDGRGRGLVGIRERVKIYGGEMAARAVPERWLRAERSAPVRGLSAMSIRVLVADDQAMVRAGFRLLLAGEPDIDVVAEAGNGLEAVRKAAPIDPPSC